MHYENAMVIGASLAGMCAARVLADHFGRVTLLERDRLPETAESRPGVPQDRHVHVLLYAGDTLYAESEVLAKRESRSRPGQGVVTILTRGHKQTGELVCSFERNMLIPARGEAVEDKIDSY